MEALTARLELPVRNLSGLSGGSYDFDVAYARDELSNPTSSPTLVTAVEAELGLKLKKGAWAGERVGRGPHRTTLRELNNAAAVA